MTKDAEAHAEEDKKAKEKIELRNNADSTAYGAEKMLKDLGDKVDAAKKTEIEDEIKKVKEALEKDDADAIKAAVESLNAEGQRRLRGTLQAGRAPARQRPGARQRSARRRRVLANAGRRGRRRFETVDKDADDVVDDSGSR